MQRVRVVLRGVDGDAAVIVSPDLEDAQAQKDLDEIKRAMAQSGAYPQVSWLSVQPSDVHAAHLMPK